MSILLTKLTKVIKIFINLQFLIHILEKKMKFLGDLLKSIRHVQEKYLAKQRAEQILKDNESIKRQVLTAWLNISPVHA